MSALIPINNINVPFEVVGENLPTVSSNYVAEVFEKNHPEILRLIRKLPNDEFKSLNFQPSTYLDAQMKPRPCYNLTRDGFSLLVMGFTGEKAYKWKIEFIKAFNLMEAELKRIAISRYVDKIADLEAYAGRQDKYRQDQINGYLGQIAKHNQKIEVLKAELVVAKNELVKFQKQDETNPRPQTLRVLLDHARKERDFYRQKSIKIEKEKADKEMVTFRALQQIKGQMEHIFTAIGAVEAYVINDDRYFLEHNEITKG